MASTSPSSSLFKKFNLISSRQRPFRVAILGQNGVGKSALTVRLITRRFIGDYDPYLERVYSCQRTINDTAVDFEILDTANTNENSKMREHIRWADGIILMYDVTDRCSFNECSRIQFLINSYSRRNRRKSGSDPESELYNRTPVTLVANKNDLEHDRMVLAGEGLARSVEMNCVGFHQVSVRENVDQISDLIEEFYIKCRNLRQNKFLNIRQNSKNSTISNKEEGGSYGFENTSSSEEELSNQSINTFEARNGKVLHSKEKAKSLRETEDEGCISRDELIMRRARYKRRGALFTVS